MSFCSLDVGKVNVLVSAVSSNVSSCLRGCIGSCFDAASKFDAYEALGYVEAGVCLGYGMG